jgi:hypothetical protein
VTPPDQVPLSAIRVPDGFQVELWAHGMPGARMMAVGDRGHGLRRHRGPSAASMP